MEFSLQCTAKKIEFMYSHKRNCAAWVLCNFHIHVSVSDLYISTFGPPIFLQQNRQPDQRNTYINRSQKHECRNWDCSHAAPFLGIFFSNLWYCVFVVCNTVYSTVLYTVFLLLKFFLEGQNVIESSYVYVSFLWIYSCGRIF